MTITDGSHQRAYSEFSDAELEEMDRIALKCMGMPKTPLQEHAVFNAARVRAEIMRRKSAP